MTCARARRLIERAFVDGALATALPAHLAECTACRDYYHRVFLAEAALASSDERPRLTAHEQELLRARVLDAAAPPRRRWRVGTVAALTAAAAAAAAALLLLPHAPRHPPLQARAEHGADGSRAALRPVGARALCLTLGPKGFEVTSLGDEPAAGEPPRCSVRDSLGFSYRNETAAPLYLMIAVRGPRGTWAAAFPEGVRLVAPAAETALGVEVPLAPLGAGRVQVYALFAPQPIPRATALEQVPTLDGQLVHLEVEIGP